MSVPGLNDEWAVHQLELPAAPVCSSCTTVPGEKGTWRCDPDRPLCPLHETPEQTRSARRVGAYCEDCSHTHRVLDRLCPRCACTERPEPPR